MAVSPYSNPELEARVSAFEAEIPTLTRDGILDKISLLMGQELALHESQYWAHIAEVSAGPCEANRALELHRTFSAEQLDIYARWLITLVPYAMHMTSFETNLKEHQQQILSSWKKERVDLPLRSLLAGRVLYWAAQAMKRTLDAGCGGKRFELMKAQAQSSPDSGAIGRRAEIDAFLQWCNDKLGRGEQIFQADITDEIKYTLRTLQLWKKGKASLKFDRKIRTVLNDPSGFVERFRTRHPV